MQWYVKHFADGRVALRPGGSLQEFQEVSAAFSSSHRGALVCVRPASNGAVGIYLAPAAAEFAIMIQASPCEKPPPEGLVPLCGSAACRALVRAAPEPG